MKIKEKLWQKLKDAKDIKSGELYWLKLGNGDIVLSAYISNQFNAGWACLQYIDQIGFMVKNGHFYIAKDAKIQPFEKTGEQ